MDKKIDVVIVGGGTAGWLSAARLAAAYPSKLHVTLVESPTIPTIGVGEGTWPSMRSTLQAIGLSERDLIRKCDASFKQGTIFRGWVTGSDQDIYMHPFSLPADYSSQNLAEWWRSRDLSVDFCDHVTPQRSIALANKAPKTGSMPDYAFALNYGYHLDAVKFAALLHDHSVNKLGVKHISADVQHISVEQGIITDIKLSDDETLKADLYIDCTGQKGLLIGQHMNSPFSSMRDCLPNNRAIVTQVPYKNADDEIAACTLSTAQTDGWVWDIGLQSRRGVGFVHNSDYLNEEQATQILLDYVKSTSDKSIAEKVKTRAVNFEPGFRPEPWRGNCIAIGLSAGFIEPLEASALAMIEQGISLLIENFPFNSSLNDPASRLFNEIMQGHWKSIREFLVLHYALSRRKDTDYWLRARSSSHIPNGLLDKMQLWQQRAPYHRDAPRYDELFPAASYQYVWLGMGAHQQNNAVSPSFQGISDQDVVDRILQDVRVKTQQLHKVLPSNRSLIKELVQ